MSNLNKVPRAIVARAIAQVFADLKFALTHNNQLILARPVLAADWSKVKDALQADGVDVKSTLRYPYTSDERISGARLQVMDLDARNAAIARQRALKEQREADRLESAAHWQENRKPPLWVTAKELALHGAEWTRRGIRPFYSALRLDYATIVGARWDEHGGVVILITQDSVSDELTRLEVPPDEILRVMFLSGRPDVYLNAFTWNVEEVAPRYLEFVMPIDGESYVLGEISARVDNPATTRDLRDFTAYIHKDGFSPSSRSELYLDEMERYGRAVANLAAHLRITLEALRIQFL